MEANLDETTVAQLSRDRVRRRDEEGDGAKCVQPASRLLVARALTQLWVTPDAGCGAHCVLKWFRYGLYIQLF